MKKFEDSIAWQKGKDLAVVVYREFESCNDFNFRDQIRRAAVSVSNNIAEGIERNTDKELRYFLYIAKGSCAELRSMCSLARELGYINTDTYDSLVDGALEVSRILGGFIKKL